MVTSRIPEIPLNLVVDFSEFVNFFDVKGYKGQEPREDVENLPTGLLLIFKRGILLVVKRGKNQPPSKTKDVLVGVSSGILAEAVPFGIGGIIASAVERAYGKQVAQRVAKRFISVLEDVIANRDEENSCILPYPLIKSVSRMKVGGFLRKKKYAVVETTEREKYFIYPTSEKEQYLFYLDCLIRYMKYIGMADWLIRNTLLKEVNYEQLIALIKAKYGEKWEKNEEALKELRAKVEQTFRDKKIDIKELTMNVYLNNKELTKKIRDALLIEYLLGILEDLVKREDGDYLPTGFSSFKEFKEFYDKYIGKWGLDKIDEE